MASNQMTGTERDEVRYAIETLIGRGTKFYPCPLVNRRELVRLWMKILPSEIEQAAKTLFQARYELGADTIEHVSFAWQQCGAVVELHLRTQPDPGPDYFLRPPASRRLTPILLTMETCRADFSKFEMGSIKPLEDWVRTIRQFDTEAVEALACFEDIMTMANTPGQIRRMVPELQQYMKPTMQLKMGARDSPLPRRIVGPGGELIKSGWAEYDKEKVQRMCHTLAKCFLIPAPENPVEFSSEVARIPWARAIDRSRG